MYVGDFKKLIFEMAPKRKRSIVPASFTKTHFIERHVMAWHGSVKASELRAAIPESTSVN